MRSAHSRHSAYFFFALAALACADPTNPADNANALAGVGNPSSSAYSCAGVVAGGTYENIKVPRGSTCTLQNVTVKGNVVALQDARLFVYDSRVDGNIQGENAAVVHVNDTRIGGSLQIHEGSSPGETGVSITGGTVLTQGSIQVTKMRTGRILIADAVLEKGNLQVEDNAVTESLEVLRNRVGQNLEVRKHFTNSSKLVSDNTVMQKLECKENDAPFVESNNSAGDRECPEG